MREKPIRPKLAAGVVGRGRVEPNKALRACWWTQGFNPVWRTTQFEAWCCAGRRNDAVLAATWLQASQLGSADGVES
ncbi:hypothetical protein ACFX13_009712 [Malus domestica]